MMEPRIVRSPLLAIAASLMLGQAAGAEAPESRDVYWWKDVDWDVPGFRGDWHIHASQGMRIDAPDGRIRLKLNGSLWADVGHAWANEAVRTAFGNGFGTDAEISRARVTLRGWLFDRGDFKFELDYADRMQVKDAWFGLVPLAWIGRVRFGNMKEPFSLDALTSGRDASFMTGALPTLALAPGRNIGAMAQNTLFDTRMTWSLGVFWNTTSFGNFDGAKDALSESIGFNVTGRLTGLPIYVDQGRRLVHVGLSLSHQRYTDAIALRAPPESKLIDNALVDTGPFTPKSGVSTAVEVAYVEGPWSLQGELIVTNLQAPDIGNPLLSGFYVSASHVLTGEHRRYDRHTGTFTGLSSHPPLSVRDGRWGAVEAALRLARVDLNGGDLRGGSEWNVTLALNWYASEAVRFALNFVHARSGARGYSPTLEGGIVNILQARFEADF